MTRRQVLILAAFGWSLVVLGVGLYPAEWSIAVAVALAGLGVAVISLFGLEVKQ